MFRVNDDLVGKLNSVAGNHFYRRRPNAQRRKRKNKGWWDRDIEMARKGRREANRKRRTLTKQFAKGEVNEEEYLKGWEEYRMAKEKTSRLIKHAMGRFELQVLERVREKGNGETREWYDFIRGKKSSDCFPKFIKVGDRVVDKPSEIKREVEKFWECIVGPMKGNMKYSFDRGSIEQRETLTMDLRRPTLYEIDVAVKRLKDNKGTGMDGIPNEFYKKGGPWVIYALRKLFGEVWDNEAVPSKWNESRVVLIFKGGQKNKNLLKNYRPISMANTVGKIFCSILNDRLKEACNRAGVLGEEQNGFRTDRRGEDNIYIYIG